MQLHTGRYRLRQISHAWMMKEILGKQQPLLPVTYELSKWESMLKFCSAPAQGHKTPNFIYLFFFLRNLKGI